MLPSLALGGQNSISGDKGQPLPIPQKTDEKKKAGLSDKKTGWILQLTLTRSFVPNHQQRQNKEMKRTSSSPDNG